jgi:hypothetical protein
MKRTSMQRTALLRAEPKPATGKPKARKCKACRAPYQPDPKRPFINWCSVACGAILAEQKLAKQKAAKAKAERAADRKRKEEGMPLKDRLKATEKLVNRCVVLRDWFDGCISCHMPSHYDGIWTASHFKSVGSNSALRFNLWNIHKGCEQCNLFKSGNITEYERRLLLKIGPERVDWLKNHERSRVYTAEYLIRLSAVARKWIKRREKRLGIR